MENIYQKPNGGMWQGAMLSTFLFLNKNAGTDYEAVHQMQGELAYIPQKSSHSDGLVSTKRNIPIKCHKQILQLWAKKEKKGISISGLNLQK